MPPPAWAPLPPAQAATRLSAVPVSATVDPVRAESAAVVAQRTGKLYELASDGVLRAELPSVLQAALGVVRLATTQSKDYVMQLDGPRESGGIDWAVDVFESPDSPPVFAIASSLGRGWVPPTNKVDLSVVNVYAKESRRLGEAWLRSCSDPAVPVLEYHGLMQADRHDELLRLTYLVTTRTTSPGESVSAQLKLRGTEYVVDKPEPGELFGVEVDADFLQHRVIQLDPALGKLLRADDLPMARALGLGIAVAREAVEATKVWSPDSSDLLTRMLDALQRGEEPAEEDWAEAQAVVIERLAKAEKHTVAEQPRKTINLEDFGGGVIEPAESYAPPFFQAMAAQSVHHLRRLFDLWGETVGDVIADIVYDAHAATEDLARIHEIVDEHIADPAKASW